MVASPPQGSQITNALLNFLGVSLLVLKEATGWPELPLTAPGLGQLVGERPCRVNLPPPLHPFFSEGFKPNQQPLCVKHLQGGNGASSGFASNN